MISVPYRKKYYENAIILCKKASESQALFNGHTERQADYGVDLHGEQPDVPGTPGLRRPHQPDRAFLL